MRKTGSNGYRISKAEDDITMMKRDLKQRQDEFDKHIRRHVVDDLLATRYNGKPLYSYADIADRYDISTSAVQRIAIDEGLTRRNKA